MMSEYIYIYIIIIILINYCEFTMIALLYSIGKFTVLFVTVFVPNDQWSDQKASVPVLQCMFSVE